METVSCSSAGWRQCFARLHLPTGLLTVLLLFHVAQLGGDSVSQGFTFTDLLTVLLLCYVAQLGGDSVSQGFTFPHVCGLFCCCFMSLGGHPASQQCSQLMPN